MCVTFINRNGAAYSIFMYTVLRSSWTATWSIASRLFLANIVHVSIKIAYTVHTQLRGWSTEHWQLRQIHGNNKLPSYQSLTTLWWRQAGSSEPLFVDPVFIGRRPRYQFLITEPQFNFSFGTLHRVAAMTDIPKQRKQADGCQECFVFRINTHGGQIKIPQCWICNILAA